MSGKKSVILIGAGSMGGSILKQWLASDCLDPDLSAIVDPSPTHEISELVEAAGIPLNPEEDQAYDICMLAVKPQMFEAVIPTLFWPEIGQTVFVSIAAGKSVQSIRTQLKTIGAGHAPVIRVMPNLPVSVGRGVSLLYADENTKSFHREIVTELMASTGDVVEVDSEDAFDIGMSISGCGPAYVFLLAEAMEQAGIEAGLSQKTAQRLAHQTVAGAGVLMAQDKRSAQDLKESVMSKGGTTAEAIRVLDGPDGVRKLMPEAVDAAVKRAKELNT